MNTIAIGSFDGIHSGHAAVIRTALACDADASVVCFEPVPRQYFGDGQWNRRLTTSVERAEAINDLGARVLIFPFDRNTENMDPGDFLEELYLREHFVTVVAGYDFHFGLRRRGSGEYLKQWCTSRGIDAIIVPPLKSEGEPVKSERIRVLLEAGDLENAESLLDRHYSLTGAVARGKGLGRSIGFPTLNVRVPRCKMLPKPGSYAGIVYSKRSGGRMPAAVFVPKRDGAPVEAHILQKTEDMYGTAVKIVLLKRLRDVSEETDLKQLSKLIAEDVTIVKQMDLKERWMEDPDQ